MHKIVEEEFKQFLLDLQEAEGAMGFGRYYIDESDYEDEYSHDDIDTAQNLFIEKVREYLHENYPGKYVVTSCFCVFIMTPERARESHLSEKIIELFTVN